MKARAGLGLGDLDVEDYSDPAKFKRDNAVLFDAISVTVGSRYIVDSSKRADRLQLLMANRNLMFSNISGTRAKVDLFFLRKNRKHQLKQGKEPHGLIRRIGDYIRTNRRIYNLIKDRPTPWSLRELA
jgi:hypothetical protein